MKRLLAVILTLSMLLTIGCIAYGSEDKDYRNLFEADQIIDIKIDISAQNLQSIVDDPTAEEYYSANITVDGVAVTNVGLRTKGNSSLNSIVKSDSDRYSYRIKLDEYVDGQNLLGLDELVINNMFSDASYMREYLAYEALREAGSPVPLAVFANIYINGELKGFYLCVEAIEDGFLERTFGNNDGNLYKQEQGSTLIYKENDEYASSELKVGDDEEKTGLKNMIKTLNDMPDGEKGNIENVLDVESALKYFAANTVLGSYDSYSGNFAQNYYLYENAGKFSVIPWDYNMSFGGFGQGLSVSLDAPVSGTQMESRPLIDNLLKVGEYKEKYLEYVETFRVYLENLQSRVDTLANRIRPYVAADPTKFITMEQFENSIIYQEEADREVNMPSGGGENLSPENMPQRPAGNVADGENKAGNTQNGDRGNMGGAFPKGERPQMPQGAALPEGDANRKAGGPQGEGMGMGGGSIITYATKKLANMQLQLTGQVATNNEISIQLDGTKLSLDAVPLNQNNRILVPLRGIFEALGASVDWNEATQTITATKEDTTVILTIGKTSAQVNSSEVALDTAPVLIGNRTMVPVRFIAEHMGLKVNWNEQSQTVIITH